MFGKVSQDSFQDIFSTHFGHDPDRFQPLFSPSRTALDSDGLQSAEESLLICQKLLSQQQQQQQQPSTNAKGSCETSVFGPAKKENSRYKTELCRPFQDNGQCKYGDKCQFAHGKTELRNVSRHPKYKTDLCRTYHSSGFCPYGPRCHFIHSLDEMKRRDTRPAASPAQPMPPLPMFTSGHRKLSLDLVAKPQYDSESGYTSSGSSSSSHSPSSFRGDSDSDSGSGFSRAPGSPTRLPVFSTLIK